MHTHLIDGFSAILIAPAAFFLRPEPAPMSEDAVAAYRKKHPEALIGRVVAVRAQDRLVSVGDVPVVDFKRGDAVTFLGASDERVGNGDVVDRCIKPWRSPARFCCCPLLWLPQN